MPDDALTTSLSADRPIQSASADLLERGPFVEALANAFSQWHGDDSLVVALYGAWGSGKTSVKNMVVETLRAKKPAPVVIEFDPWAWSGQERLLSAFFTEIGIAIGRHSEKADAKAIASRWHKYGSRLALGGKALGAAKTITSVIGVPILPLLFGKAADVAKQASDLAEATAKAHDDGTPDEPLEDLKASLAALLKKSEAPLLVVMDDVDRLTRDEIRLLFQLVKINADFPKIVYFLLFDRKIIEDALTGISSVAGRDYMEKIVQVGFDLPQAGQRDLDQAFTGGLDRILNFEGATRNFDNERWANLYVSGLRYMIGTMRDVHRFLSTFSFTIGLFRRNKSLEVNVIDLIGLEMLRVFEPEVYHALPNERATVLREQPSILGGGDDSKERKQRLEKLLAVATNQNREATQAILADLFPAVGWMLRNYGYGMGYEDGWIRGLRVCHPEIFERYFAMAVPRGDVPQAIIDTILDRAGDRAFLREVFLLARQNNLLVPLLERLEAYKSVIDLSVAEPFITALFDIGDDLPQGRPGLFGVGPDMHICRIIFHYLVREKDQKTRGRILLKALEETTGLRVPLMKVSIEMDRSQKPTGSNEFLLDEEELAAAKSLCLKKIEVVAASGKLIGPDLQRLLWAWKNMGGEEASKQFAARIASTLEGGVLLLRGFMQEIKSGSMGSVVTHSRWEIQLKSVETFVDLGQLQAVLAPLLGATVPPEHADLAKAFAPEITAFKRALRRREQGKPDDPFLIDDADNPSVP